MGEPIAALSLWKGPIQLAPCPGQIRLTQSVLDAELDYVCHVHKVLKREVMSDERRRAVAYARFELVWRLRQHKWPLGGAKYSYPEIGRALGRDHSSVINAERRWEQILAARIAAE